MKINYFLGFFVLIVLGMGNAQCVFSQEVKDDIKVVTTKADKISKVVGDYVTELNDLDKKDAEYEQDVAAIVQNIKVSLNIK